ncbi:translation initiation factor IF-2 N-terminal domain-containing protein [Sporolactobacillus vineae]|uniref:translation initiation factor IF-2 N-terminal domain-containing protein n=1 Tax=Sporolactobacillus vineae TaxID=444463 RepID=UPI000288D7A5|nr:translation initiation factor IF-2 N-terminal domain-containing protein [Sporolactobacillus vineae]
MSKMRIYEYARENHVTSKRVIEILEGLGFQVKSHMSVIEDNAIKQLNRKFNPKKEPVAVATKTEPKKRKQRLM